MQTNWLTKACCYCYCSWCCCCCCWLRGWHVSFCPNWPRVSVYRFHYAHLRQCSQIKPIIIYPPWPIRSQRLSAAVGCLRERFYLQTSHFALVNIWPYWKEMARFRGPTDHPSFGNLRNHFDFQRNRWTIACSSSPFLRISNHVDCTVIDILNNGAWINRDPNF